ncbi:MAG: hypothetical protein SH817_08685 [Leptospira sp.]|nr:hypothetical protein [Leptospira sp.]
MYTNLTNNLIIIKGETFMVIQINNSEFRFRHFPSGKRRLFIIKPFPSLVLSDLRLKIKYRIASLRVMIQSMEEWVQYGMP